MTQGSPLLYTERGKVEVVSAILDELEATCLNPLPRRVERQNNPLRDLKTQAASVRLDHHDQHGHNFRRGDLQNMECQLLCALLRLCRLTIHEHP